MTFGNVSNLHLSYFYKVNKLKTRNNLFLVFCFFHYLWYSFH